MHKAFSVIAAVICLLLSGTAGYAQPDVTFSGDAEYRLRYHYVKLTNEKGKDSSAAPDFLNTYAWNLRLKINVNKNLFFGVRLSNPSGYASDKIPDNLEWVGSGNYTVLSLPELYFRWSAGLFSLSAGAIPVAPNAVLNLVAYEHKNYSGAGTDSWALLMNNSQKGLNFEFRIVDNESFSFGANLLAAMARDAAGVDTANAMVHDQVRLMLTLPATLRDDKLSLLPAMHVRFNNFRTLDTMLDEASHTIAGGLDVHVRPIDGLSILLGAAGGLFNNECQKGDYLSDDQGAPFPVTQIAPLGMLFHFGLANKDAVGKAKIDFKFGRSRDREASPAINSNLLHWDVSYDLPVKSLSILPRLRIWYYTREETDKHETRVRPELILKANF